MGARLEITKAALAEIRSAASAAYPREACGLLLGVDGFIQRAQAVANVAAQPEREFEIDPAALFAALRLERAGGPGLIGYWHSHPSGSVVPSSRDLDAATDDGRVWVIVAGDDIAAWRVWSSDVFDFEGAQPEDLAGVRVVRPICTRSTKSFRRIAMKTGEVRHLVPRDKCDEDIVSLIVEAGFPAIAPILDDLMEWTADPNWPVAPPLIDYLNTIGDPMVEPIRKVLRGEDADHKLLVIRHMVPALPSEARLKLVKQLRALANRPTDADRWASVDVEATALLSGLSGSRA